ncbi:recombinase family protein [Kitasatospora sp. NPDC056731]|uniref:recombinase family protein n=1 Tax=Kitasatospora sp. NPDC056731 TaxID=3155422 RepID=UPI0034453408
MRAVSYMRQSKKREDGSQASSAAQRTRTEALIVAKGWENNGHFEDVGKSGWDPNVTRPGFEEMMAVVRAGQVDAVIVYSLSRLTRQGALEPMKINGELSRYGVRLVSVEEPYLDTSTPMGVAIFGLIAAGWSTSTSGSRSPSAARTRAAPCGRCAASAASATEGRPNETSAPAEQCGEDATTGSSDAEQPSGDALNGQVKATDPKFYGGSGCALGHGYSSPGFRTVCAVLKGPSATPLERQTADYTNTHAREYAEWRGGSGRLSAFSSRRSN